MAAIPWTTNMVPIPWTTEQHSEIPKFLCEMGKN